MYFTSRLLAALAGSFAIGLFTGLLLPPIWIVVMQGAILVFIAFCILCG